MTQLSSSLLPTDDTGDLSSGTPPSRAFWATWRDAINTLVHSTVNTAVTPKDIIDEVVAARGGQANLDAYLDTIVALIGTSGDAVDIPATFGEDVSAGHAIYLSSGSGGKTAGRWYKADSANAYSSSAAKLAGFAPTAVLAGVSGFARISGRITGLSGLVAGTAYYASSTPGVVTSTPPALVLLLGVAESTTVLAFPAAIQEASATIPGHVSIGAQTLAGVKTFAAFPLGLGMVVFSRSTADATFNANTTLANITGCSFVVGANETWIFEFVMSGKSSDIADYKLALTGPAAPTSINYSVISSQDAPTTSAVTAFGSAAAASGAAGTEQGLLLNGILRNGANAGTVQLQAAQLVSDATDTVIRANSYVRAWRVA